MRIKLPATKKCMAMLFGAVSVLLAGHVKADVCSAAMTDIAFGNVSPVSGQDYFASGTLSITCTFIILDGNIIVLPNINACASLGPGAGSGSITTRMLTSGSRKIAFNLYRDTSYAAASIWGGYDTSTSITQLFSGLLAIGTKTVTFPVYAKLAASDLALAAVDAGTGTSATYSTSFAGAGVLNYTSGSIIVRPCQTSGQNAPFSFNVTANIINDCLINTSPVAFGSKGALTSAVRATGNLSVKCTSASSYQIALNGGTANNAVSARKMKNAGTGQTVNYVLSSSLDGPIWGDGTGGTVMYQNSGTGLAQQITVYGLVPTQSTPPPGDYSDRITATIYF